MSRAKNYFNFFTAAVQRPFKIGAIAPSSRQLAEMMLLKFKPGDHVAEVGPGTGAITEVLRRRLASPGDYIGFDINRDFIDSLKEQFPDLKFVQDSAENLNAKFQDEAQLDYIVCSLPWSIWPDEHQAEVLKGMLGPLKKGGYFATFAYWPMLYGPTGYRFRALLEMTFSRVELSAIVWANLPPAIVYVCSK